MIIKDKQISQHRPPFIVAEMSCNHNGNYGTALQIINEAAEAGCDACKLQVYEPSEITIDADLFLQYQKSAMPFEWLEGLFHYAERKKIILFASVFGLKGLKILEELNCPAYKIASFEMSHLPLIDAIRKTGKPIFVSTGMMDFSDLASLPHKFDLSNTILLKCVSSYPAEPCTFNLKTLPDMRSLGFEVGISDHSEGIGVSLAAIAMGAVVVEKHFTINKQTACDSFSITPMAMQRLVTESKIVWESIGQIDYTTRGDKYYNRSLYAISHIIKGEEFTEKNIGILRPNRGLDAKAYYTILGKKAMNDIKKGEPLRREYVE